MVCVCVVNVQLWLQRVFAFRWRSFYPCGRCTVVFLWAPNFYVALAQMTACYAIISGMRSTLFT